MGRGPRIQHVSIVGTKPITKLEFYSKQLRNTFIALLTIAIIAIVIGGLIVGGVIHVKGYNPEALDFFFGAAGTDILQNQDKLETLGKWLIVIGALVTIISVLAIPTFQWLSKFDRPVSPKVEAFLKKSLQKLYYRVVKRAENAKIREENKAMKAKLMADYKAKKK